MLPNTLKLIGFQKRVVSTKFDFYVFILVLIIIQLFSKCKFRQYFANSYNETHHRTVGVSSNKVTETKETNMWWKM
jgi:hypothetical protein